MSAYVIAETEIRDAKLIETYRELAKASIERHGGRYIVRGGATELIEGGPEPRMMIVVEFPSMAQAKAWYASADYAEALKVRRDALDRRLIFVEGV
ncbi:DUF1330 domain-containing protein [Terrarubrum flagellatum]|uniref:DUF1330 domain-containing protein n=1 Tax=Terrirubrum flagellatum TaxID=2895980 RepID=UPI0031450914